MRSVHVYQRAGTAVIDSGATHGEVYYAVSKASKQLTFAAGLCHTIGIGGGFGMLLRKYGGAIDNILDATLVNAEGRLVNKKAMGKDVFLAIRGGGGESFGIVLSWKVMFVPVLPKVTMFKVPKTLADGAVGILT
jgi:FAD/FMN-containing dehydrogenase